MTRRKSNPEAIRKRTDGEVGNSGVPGCLGAWAPGNRGVGRVSLPQAPKVRQPVLPADRRAVSGVDPSLSSRGLPLVHISGC